MELHISITRVLEQCAPTETIPAWSFAPALPLPGGYSSEKKKKKAERQSDRESQKRRDEPGGGYLFEIPVRNLGLTHFSLKDLKRLDVRRLCILAHPRWSRSDGTRA